MISGNIWKYGDNVNTDVIYPGKYLYTISDPNEMVDHALEGLDPSFAEGMKPNDIIVAGKNWGCGSSREQAVICLKERGIGAIIAASFARIYYRNCLNSALIAIPCPEAAEAIQDKETISIDFSAGKIRCRTGTFTFQPLPKLLQEIINMGGLVAYVRRELAGAK
jgi:3-isopropylmalate/(R)-2-methylmalate dehydratase small subunit